jgi:hypothetical protein
MFIHEACERFNGEEKSPGVKMGEEEHKKSKKKNEMTT